MEPKHSDFEITDPEMDTMLNQLGDLMASIDTSDLPQNIRTGQMHAIQLLMQEVLCRIVRLVWISRSKSFPVAWA